MTNKEATEPAKTSVELDCYQRRLILTVTAILIGRLEYKIEYDGRKVSRTKQRNGFCIR